MMTTEHPLNGDDVLRNTPNSPSMEDLQRYVDRARIRCRTAAVFCHELAVDAHSYRPRHFETAIAKASSILRMLPAVEKTKPDLLLPAVVSDYLAYRYTTEFREIHHVSQAFMRREDLVPPLLHDPNLGSAKSMAEIRIEREKKGKAVTYEPIYDDEGRHQFTESGSLKHLEALGESVDLHRTIHYVQIHFLKCIRELLLEESLKKEEFTSRMARVRQWLSHLNFVNGGKKEHKISMPLAYGCLFYEIQSHRDPTYTMEMMMKERSPDEPENLVRDQDPLFGSSLRLAKLYLQGVKRDYPVSHIAFKCEE